ncbi:hypothetical protein B296_00024183 [Ensete ventricosum]|uniref:Cathepsin propeptide inhibitor domain-containing protein n=1 Tax=Ensete ventricosum TaxID=4639 RepID=A0A427AAD9_ENSVE|nr:hypothetical protein B296_00024183 [Ensete ventricosum]
MGLGVLLSFVAVFLFLLTFSDGALHGSDDPEIVQVTQSRRLGSTERRFRAFLRTYGKEYRTREEYTRRLGVFARNLARAAEHQALDPTAVHGVTPFFDLTEDEFEAAFTGLSAQDKAGWPGRGAEFPTATAMEVGDLPSSFDWRNKGAVTDVKMQVIQNTGTICSILLHGFSIVKDCRASVDLAGHSARRELWREQTMLPQGSSSASASSSS